MDFLLLIIKNKALKREKTLYNMNLSKNLLIILKKFKRQVRLLVIWDSSLK